MLQSTLDEDGYFLKDGKRENFLIKSEGKSFRCGCGCNVFSKLVDETYGEVYECNACETWFTGE